MVNILNRLMLIDYYYDIIFGENLSEGPRFEVGTQTPRFCRFCRFSEPRVSFQNDAHAVSESIGNKRLILLEECDECNTHFSENLEDSFDKFTQPFRTMFGIKGKKGAPSYKTNDHTARLDVDLTSRELKVQGNEAKIFEPNESANHHIMKFRRGPYRPLAVYKALIKMTLSIMPREDLFGLESTVEWIRYGTKSELFVGPHFMSQRLIPGPSFGQGLMVMVFRRKPHVQSDVPKLMIFVQMGNLVIQAGVPFENEKIMSLPLFPIPGEHDEKYGKVRSEGIDLTSDVLTRDETLSFGMSQLEKTGSDNA